MSGAAVAASPLPEMLGRLKLTAMRDRLDGLLDEAARRDLALPEALALLCEAEVAHREERRIQMGLGIAKFPYVRTLEGFDFAAQPSLDPRQVHDLAACRWVANGDTLLIQGPPGVGKSHLAVALGREAVRRGYSVLFTPAMALITALAKGQAEGRLEERLTRYAKPKLLIVDEFGYLPLEPQRGAPALRAGQHPAIKLSGRIPARSNVCGSRRRTTRCSASWSRWCGASGTRANPTSWSRGPAGAGSSCRHAARSRPAWCRPQRLRR